MLVFKKNKKYFIYTDELWEAEENGYFTYRE